MSSARGWHRARAWGLLGLCCGLLFAAAGCGYTVGAPFSPEIRSVYVPTFTSSSNRRWLEYQLTESVQKRIQERSPYRLARRDEADTILTGRIVDATKRTLGQTNNSDPRELQMNLQVEVTWEDARTHEILRQQRIPIGPEAMQLAAQSEFAPEVGLSMATGTREVVDRLARNIVDMMEAPWEEMNRMPGPGG
ncbi:MAG: LPS assembly lipoprotein LptE [Planctomycetales bacterium]